MLTPTELLGWSLLTNFTPPTKLQLGEDHVSEPLSEL